MHDDLQAQALLEKIIGLRQASREVLALFVEIDRRYGPELGEGKESILPVAALLEVDASLQEAETTATQLVKRLETRGKWGHHGAEELNKISFFMQVARTVYIAIRDGFEFWLRDS